MPCASMLYAFGIQMLIIDILRLAGYKAPIRISSLPRGTPLRPGIYSIIEDVCAVDGSGGTEFRQRLNLRYQASHYFRQMLHRLTLFWAIGALLAASATTAIIFTCSRDVAYVVRVRPSILPRHVNKLTTYSGWMDIAVCMGCRLGSRHHTLGAKEFEARSGGVASGARKGLSREAYTQRNAMIIHFFGVCPHGCTIPFCKLVQVVSFFPSIFAVCESPAKSKRQQGLQPPSWRVGKRKLNCSKRYNDIY